MSKKRSLPDSWKAPGGPHVRSIYLGKGTSKNEGVEMNDDIETHLANLQVIRQVVSRRFFINMEGAEYLNTLDYLKKILEDKK